jgi:hypothetical protein
VLAGALALGLLVMAALASMSLQPRQGGSSAFLQRVEAMADVSAAAANRGVVTAKESVELEQRALGLLELASEPDVLSGLGATEAERAHQRLIDARSALAAVVGENPSDTRALAALAAISGLLDGTPPASTAGGSAAPHIEASPATQLETSTPEVPGIAATATVATAVVTPRPEATSGADNSRGSSAVPAAASTPDGAATAGAAVSDARPACARVYDAASLSDCADAVSTASAACAVAHGADGCQTALEAALGGAQQRVQRVGEDCQRLPNARAREACSDATNKSSGNGRSNEKNNGRSGSGQRNESGSPGRRD